MKFIAILSFLLIYTQVAFGGSLTVNSVRAREEAKSFSLEVGLRTSGNYYSKLDLDVISLYDYVSVSPKVPFTITTQRRGFVLLGDFKPQTKYTLKFKAGLSTNKGYSLENEKTRSVRTGDFRARFGFDTSARYVPTRFQAQIPWEAVNLEKVKVTVRRVYTQNLHQWISSGQNASQYVSDVVYETEITTKGSKNKIKKGVLSLEKLAPLGRGVYNIQYSVEKPYLNGSSSLIVTDLSAVTKLAGKNELKTWVFNTDTLLPLTGADVILYSMANRKIGECSTSGGEAGCSIKWKEDKANRPYSVIVRKGKDLSYIRLSDAVLRNDSFHAGTRQFSGSKGKFEAYIYSQRDLYRPGETVHLATVLRNAKFKSVPKMSVKWEIVGPRGKVVKETVTKTSFHGVSTLDFPTGGMSDTGSYTARLKTGEEIVASFRFLVEEFVPERIKVDLKGAKKGIIAPALANFKINADYLFGAPVKNGNWRSTCMLKPAFKHIPGNKNYHTGIYTDQDEIINLDAKTGDLDANGKGTMNCSYETQLGAKLSQAYKLHAKVDVFEAGSGRASVQTATAVLSGTPNLVGLAKGKTRNRKVTVNGGLFNLQGKPVKASSDIELKLFRVTTNWYYSYGSGYSNWRTEKVIGPGGYSKKIKAKNGKFKETITIPERWGQWMVRAVDIKTGYTADLFLGYIGYSSWRQANSKASSPAEKLDLRVSKKEVAPGDNFKVMVSSPFKGRLLVSLESNQFYLSRWVNVKKPGPVEVSFKAPNALPNFYVTGLLLKTPREGKNYIPARAWAAQSVQVIPKKHKLDVKLQHAKLSRSRKEVVINLSNKQKEKATYSLAVVDEGILQMTKFKSPDPLAHFFEARMLGVSTYETLGSTFARNTVTPGGGGAEASFADAAGAQKDKVMPVKLVNYWFGKVNSDKKGRAQVKIQLPAFQGQVRIMAVAHNTFRMGSAESSMKVRDPIITQPTLPRFLTTGDFLQVPVAVTNMSGKSQSVKVNLSANNLLNLQSKSKTLQLKNGEQKVAVFPIVVKNQVGRAKFSIKASSGKFKYEEKIDIPIKPKGVEHTMHLSLNSQKPNPLAKIGDPNWKPGLTRYSLKVSNMPYMAQLSHIQNLVRYPYGCIEQTTSTTMPLLGIREILPWLEQKEGEVKTDKDAVNDMIQAGIERILSMQTPSGGFTYWPGRGQADYWGTIYATNMLLEAKKLKHGVPAGALKEALDYIAETTNNNPYSPFKGGYSSNSATPFALYVLAKGGRKITSTLRKTADSFESYKKKNQYSKWRGIVGENFFFLGAAAKIVGDKVALRILENKDIMTAKFSGERDHQYTYYSPFRSDGLRLSVMEDLWPNAAENEVLSRRVAQFLAKKNYYYTTQEMAWGILGLGKRLKKFDKVDASALKKVRLLLNGKTLKPSGNVKGMPVYSLKSGTKGSLSVKGIGPKDGVFVYVDATGYSEKPPKSQGQLTISRKYYDQNGVPVNLNQVKTGDVLSVNLAIRKNFHQSLPNIAVVDRLPAGFEIENSRLGRGEEQSWHTEKFNSDYTDIRDDRIHVFGTMPYGTRDLNIYYTIRAVTPGTFVAPPSFIEAMYDPANFAYDEAQKVKIQ